MHRTFLLVGVGTTVRMRAVVAGVFLLAASAPLGSTPMRFIDVEVVSNTSANTDDGCGPRAVLLHVAPREAWVGEDGRNLQHVRSDAGLTGVLRRLKNERKDREVVVVQIDDGVSFGWLVHVLDIAQTEGFPGRRIAIAR
jgi:biopolymer transport protein ExbD